MSCTGGDPRLRLLDRLTGWDEAVVEGLAGLDDSLRLAGLAGTGIPAGALDPLLPPPRLARGCDDCSWFLVTPVPPAARLLALGPCDADFRPLGRPALADPRGLAFDRGRLAIADRGANRVWIIDTASDRITGEADVRHPVAVAFGPGGGLTIAGEDGLSLVETDAAGMRPVRRLPPPPAAIVRMAWSSDCQLWIATEVADGFALYRFDGTGFVAADLAGLAAAFAARPLVTGWRGFTLPAGSFNWFGRPIAAGSIGALPPPAAYVAQGQLLTLPLDSGLPGCRWHRLRIEAEVPAGCSLEVAVSTSEAAAPAPQGLNPPRWGGFAAGVPHPDDWQVVTAPADDVLIAQPPGRYLFIRVRMAGPGTATPRLHRLRLDLPRASSADLLPAVYREDPDAGDFTTRFLALFDSALEDLEGAVVRAPGLFDLGGIPDALLPWLAAVIGFALDDSWPAERRRALLAAAADLYRRRGTPGALRDVIRLATGQEAVIGEPGLARAWGGLGSARLGRVRLFDRGAARVRLGSSTIGRARVLSLGDPDLDPHSSDAFRLRIDLPAMPAAAAEALARLLDDFVPAHLLFDLVPARRAGFWMLPAARLAVDTSFATPPPAVLGDGLALGRTTILPGPRTRAAADC